QMQQVKNMGPISGLLDMMPGLSGIKQQLGGASLDDNYFKQSEAIIQSMTVAERRKPDILNGSRRRRIAAGSGTTPADVNRLMNQFQQAKKLMQMMATAGKGGGGGGGLRRLLGM
ncbi:MAG: signal recognition particle protein, partial [Dehalococcoidia bacterium]